MARRRPEVYALAALLAIYLSWIPLEFRLLASLVRHAGQILSPDQLLEMAWHDPLVQPDQVKLYVSRLRQKLEDPEAIETVRGFGYRYLPPPS